MAVPSCDEQVGLGEVDRLVSEEKLKPKKNCIDEKQNKDCWPPFKHPHFSPFL